MFSEIGRTYIAGFLSPTSLLGILLIISTLLVMKNKIRIAKIMLMAVTISYVLMSLSPAKQVLFSFFEKEYPMTDNNYEYVVVLGGKIFPNEKHPTGSQITPSLLSRLALGVALVKKYPERYLILTGNGAMEKTEAELMRQFAVEMGVPTEKIIMEKESTNTSDHPKYLKPILKNKKFVIVTSAYHMERALHNFEAHGLHGIPYATDYQNKSSLSAASFIMRGENFAALDRVTTEIYSTLWTKIKAIF